MPQSWQENWEAFVEEVQFLLNSGTCNEELAKRFGGQSFKWTGILDEKRLDGLSPGVEITLPTKTITLPNGQSTPMNGIALPIASESLDKWRKAKTGKSVTFTATFVAGSHVFSPVELKTMKSGRLNISIRVKDGVVI